MPVPYFLTLLRLIVPLSILKWPLWGLVASAFLDLRDWGYVNFQKESDYVFYQVWDKVFDIYYLTLALSTVRFWKDKTARNIAFFLYIYRLIGVVLFWVTGSRIFLFFFPNVFENFFVFYLLYVFFLKKTKLIIPRVLPVLVGVLVLPKLVMEYFLHIAQRQLWQIYNFGAFVSTNQTVIDNINFWVQALLFYLIPFAMGLLIIKDLNKKS